MPQHIEPKNLMEIPQANSMDAPPGKVGAVPCGATSEVGQNLKQFTESVHSKGSQVVSWIQGVEGMDTDRSRKLLRLKWFVPFLLSSFSFWLYSFGLIPQTLWPHWRVG